MRALIQRVSQASCTVNGKVTGRIGEGLLVFLGIRTTDTAEDRDYVIRKLLTLKLFSADDKKFDRTVLDTGGSILLISQFTLYGSLRKGTKPEFSKAMQPDLALITFNEFADKLGESLQVEKGSFGEFMKISSVNEGPVSFILATDHLSHHG